MAIDRQVYMEYVHSIHRVVTSILNMIDNYFLQLMPASTTLKSYIRVQTLNRNVHYKLCGMC